MIIIPHGTCRTLNDYTCSYGGVIICLWMTPPSPAAAAAAGAGGWRRLDSSSSLHLVSSRVAALRAVGRTSEQLSGASLSVPDKQSCVPLRPGGPSRCLSPPLTPLSASLHPVSVWRFGAACVEMLETVAPLKWTQVRFILLVAPTSVFNGFYFPVVQFYWVFFHHIARPGLV